MSSEIPTFEIQSWQNQIVIDLTIDSNEGSDSDRWDRQGGNGNDELMYDYYDDGDCDSAADNISLDLNNSGSMMTQAQYKHDVQAANDKPPSHAIDLAARETPLDPIATRSSSIGFDEEGLEQERSNTLSASYQAADS